MSGRGGGLGLAEGPERKTSIHYLLFLYNFSDTLLFLCIYLTSHTFSLHFIFYFYFYKIDFLRAGESLTLGPGALGTWGENRILSVPLYVLCAVPSLTCRLQYSKGSSRPVQTPI